MTEKIYKNCQSCGMPLSKDPGGTNTDGSKSTMYCSKCFTKGKFNNSEIDTAEKMQKFVTQKMKEMHFPGFIAWFFTKNIPNLERWKKS